MNYAYEIRDVNSLFISQHKFLPLSHLVLRYMMFQVLAILGAFLLNAICR